MANLTTFFNTKTGNVNVTITDTDAAANISIVGMSDIAYEFDLVPDKPQIDSIVAQYNAIDLSFYLYDEQGNDLYDRLSAATENIITITINHHNGETSYYRFSHTAKDVTVDELNKIVKVKAKPYRPSFTIGQMFANANYSTSLIDTTRTDAANVVQEYQSFAPGRFIKLALEQAYLGTANVIPSLNYAAQANPGSPPAMSINTFESFVNTDIGNFVDENVFVIVNIHSALGYSNVTLANGTSVKPEDVPALDVVTSLAVAEGSVIGAGVNPFYRHRLRSNDSVTINYSDLTDLQYQRNYASVRFYFSELKAPAYSPSGTLRYVPNMNTTNANVAFNDTASRFVTLRWQPGFPFLTKGTVQLRVGDDPAVNADITANVDLDAALRIAGDNAYYSVFAGDSPSFIEGTIRGMTKLKPYEPIEFGTDVPARYQNKKFRPTFLSYNVVSDEVRFKAYEIT